MGFFNSLFGKKKTVELEDENGNIVKRKIDKKLLDNLVAQGKIKKTDSVEVIEAHILDPNEGCYLSNWIVGEDVDPETVKKFATKNNRLYVIVAYEEGKPHTLVTTKEIWGKQCAIFNQIDNNQAYEADMESLLSDIKEKMQEED